MKHFRRLFFFLVLLSSAVISLPAQVHPSNPDSALVDILAGLGGTTMSLNDAVQHSLRTGPTVLAAQASLDAARGIVRRESGSFDPILTLGWGYTDQKTPSASFFAGASVLRTVQGTGHAGLTWDLPVGTQLTASLDAVRLTTNSSFAFLTPQYTTIGALSLRQPLLRGLHVSARKQLTSAEHQLESAQALYDQEVLLLATNVELVYWDLFAAERDYAVQKLTRDQAAAFLSDTELRARTGLIGPNQVAIARTFLAEQEILLLDREEHLDKMSDQLAVAVGVRPEKDSPRFRTVDQPRTLSTDDDTDVLVRESLQRNLTLRAVRADIDARKTLADAASWESLPSVDLVGSLGGSGLSGTAQNVFFGNDTLRTSVGGQLNDAIRQAVNRDFPTWSIGLEVSVPIGFRSGLGEEDRLEAEVAAAEQRYTQQERILEAAIRSGWRELQNGRRRLDAARTGVSAAEEQVRIGTIEFQNGRSTAFELVRLGADLAVAQQRYSQALVRGAKAAANLKQLSSGAFSNQEDTR